MVLSRAGTLQLRYNGHTFNKHVTRGEKVYWRCSQYLVYRCKVRIQTMLDEFSISKNDHNHPVVVRPRAYGSLKLLKQRPEFEFQRSTQRGTHLLMVNGVKFFRNRQRNDKHYWKCHQYYKRKCPCTVVINETTSNITVKYRHNHNENPSRKYKELVFVSGLRGTPKLIVDGYSFIRNKGNFRTTYWRCSKLRTMGCKAKVITSQLDNKVSVTDPVHYSTYSNIQYVMSSRGAPQLDIEGFRFTRKHKGKQAIQWICVQNKAIQCKARATTTSRGMMRQLINIHNHPPQMQRRKAGELRELKRQMEERTMLWHDSAM
ncbi:hypothetical protein RP20_CCG001713 [Aedes albopictus]|nr:hypothetical protein RP20_CCG001713 [Aedes albopictus]